MLHRGRLCGGDNVLETPCFFGEEKELRVDSEFVVSPLILAALRLLAALCSAGGHLVRKGCILVKALVFTTVKILICDVIDNVRQECFLLWLPNSQTGTPATERNSS